MTIKQLKEQQADLEQKRRDLSSRSEELRQKNISLNTKLEDINHLKASASNKKEKAYMDFHLNRITEADLAAAKKIFSDTESELNDLNLHMNSITKAREEVRKSIQEIDSEIQGIKKQIWEAITVDVKLETPQSETLWKLFVLNLNSGYTGSYQDFLIKLFPVPPSTDVLSEIRDGFVKKYSIQD